MPVPFTLTYSASNGIFYKSIQFDWSLIDSECKRHYSLDLPVFAAKLEPEPEDVVVQKRQQKRKFIENVYINLASRIPHQVLRQLLAAASLPPTPWKEVPFLRQNGLEYRFCGFHPMGSAVVYNYTEVEKQVHQVLRGVDEQSGDLQMYTLLELVTASPGPESPQGLEGVESKSLERPKSPEGLEDVKSEGTGNLEGLKSPEGLKDVESPEGLKSLENLKSEIPESLEKLKSPEILESLERSEIPGGLEGLEGFQLHEKLDELCQGHCQEQLVPQEELDALDALDTHEMLEKFKEMVRQKALSDLDALEETAVEDMPTSALSPETGDDMFDSYEGLNLPLTPPLEEPAQKYFFLNGGFFSDKHIYNILENHGFTFPCMLPGKNPLIVFNSVEDILVYEHRMDERKILKVSEESEQTAGLESVESDGPQVVGKAGDAAKAGVFKGLGITVLRNGPFIDARRLSARRRLKAKHARHARARKERKYLVNKELQEAQDGDKTTESSASAKTTESEKSTDSDKSSGSENSSSSDKSGSEASVPSQADSGF